MQALFKAGDLAGVARCYADDAVILGPGDQTIGRKAIDTYWTRMADPIAWILDLDTAVASGDLLIARGRSTLALKRGTFIVDFDLTWRRQQDGSLRIIADVYRPVRQ
ncbi:MAG: nuclear transport factor 2 family protein [Planctomycetes bacterium]|nr:nuclear transport factor 2 family protein [Planctomycetota bacterium]